MVRDLILDIKERDLLFEDKSNRNIPVFDSVWGNLFDEDKSIDALICNIIIPEEYWRSIGYQNNELYCQFTSQYMPDTRDFRIRLVALKNGNYSLFSNIRGDFGTPVMSYAFSNNIASPIPACTLPYIDIDGQFLVKIVKSQNSEIFDRAYIYSSKISDISVNYSDDQASQLLSLCAPGKSYRYPTTGVGIIKYLNSVIDHTDLRDVLETQFNGDNKPIISADFDNRSCALDVLCNPEKEVHDSNLERIENLNFEFFDVFSDDYIRRNIVLNELSESDFIALLKGVDVLNIFLFKSSDAAISRISEQTTEGRFDCDGNIIEDSDFYIVSASLEPNTIVMFDDDTQDSYIDSPVFIINGHDETRLYTSLIEQPYWIDETCHKCAIINKTSTLKYMISKAQYKNGKGLFVVDQSSENIKNMVALVQDPITGRLSSIVSNNTNIGDVVLDELTNRIYAQVQ